MLALRLQGRPVLISGAAAPRAVLGRQLQGLNQNNGAPKPKIPALTLSLSPAGSVPWSGPPAAGLPTFLQKPTPHKPCTKTSRSRSLGLSTEGHHSVKRAANPRRRPSWDGTPVGVPGLNSLNCSGFGRILVSPPSGHCSGTPSRSHGHRGQTSGRPSGGRSRMWMDLGMQ